MIWAPSGGAIQARNALETQDQQANQMFQEISQSLDDSLDKLKGRQQYIQEQEPQYKNIK